MPPVVNKIINPESNYYCYVSNVQEFVLDDLKVKKKYVSHMM